MESFWRSLGCGDVDFVNVYVQTNGSAKARNLLYTALLKSSKLTLPFEIGKNLRTACCDVIHECRVHREAEHGEQATSPAAQEAVKPSMQESQKRVSCLNCLAALPDDSSSGRVQCKCCKKQWTLQDGDYAKDWCVQHEGCLSRQEAQFGVCRALPPPKQMKCKACGVQFHPTPNAVRGAWQAYKHVLARLSGGQ